MEQVVPVKAGEVYEVEIQGVGSKGDGIARVKGFVVFVSGVQKGDYVKLRVTKVLQKAAFGELIEKLKKPARVQKPRSKKFATVSMADLARAPSRAEVSNYEETDDFGADIEDEDEM